VDLHSQERQTPLPTSYSVNQPRFAEASVANALRALATLTAIITRLPLSKIEIINHLQHTLLSNALTPFAFQQKSRKDPNLNLTRMVKGVKELALQAT